MGTAILIIGESGTGKSTSIRTLDPKETFIINVLDKPLPFRGFKKSYQPLSDEGGNYYATDDHEKILRIMEGVDEKRPDIKNLIIDDFQYIMANEFMRRATERGFDKFSEMGQHAWQILHKAEHLRGDLVVYVLSHSERDEGGIYKAKTIGKLLNQNITIEGMFSIVFHALIIDDKYMFLTQNDGQHIAKAPLEMFDERLIPNDLRYVKEKIDAYFNQDLED